MLGAPKAMHGPPVTLHVTSPTRREFSESISVLRIVPLMSSARTTAADMTNAATMLETTESLRVFMDPHLFFQCDDVAASGAPYSRGVQPAATCFRTFSDPDKSASIHDTCSWAGPSRVRALASAPADISSTEMHDTSRLSR